MDYSLPGSSVHGDSPGKNTGVDCHALLQRVLPTGGSNPGLPCCRWILYHLSHQGSPRILEWVAHPFSRGSLRPKSWTGVPCITGRFFPSWAATEAFGTRLCLVAQLCLFVTPQTVACQAPLSMGILKARILEWVAMPCSRESSQPRDQTAFGTRPLVSESWLWFFSSDLKQAQLLICWMVILVPILR